LVTKKSVKWIDFYSIVKKRADVKVLHCATRRVLLIAHTRPREKTNGKKWIFSRALANLKRQVNSIPIVLFDALQEPTAHLKDEMVEFPAAPTKAFKSTQIINHFPLKFTFINCYFSFLNGLQYIALKPPKLINI
jgi:hypothetical protein